MKRCCPGPTLWLAALAFAVPAGAGAQQPPTEEAAALPETSAKLLFERGVAHSRDGLWSEAVAAFDASIAIEERPVTRYNLAVALHRSGRSAAALVALARYFELIGDDADPDREPALQLQELARAQVATLELQIMPADARLLLDGDVCQATARSEA